MLLFLPMEFLNFIVLVLWPLAIWYILLFFLSSDFLQSKQLKLDSLIVLLIILKVHTLQLRISLLWATNKILVKYALNKKSEHHFSDWKAWWFPINLCNLWLCLWLSLGSVRTPLELRSKLFDIASVYQTQRCRRRLQSTEKENTALSQGAHVFKQQQAQLCFPNIFNDQKWCLGMT